MIANAAQKWSVPASECATEPSAVVHKASGRRMTYGDIAAFAEVPANAPQFTPADLKPMKDFRLIGKDIPRVDVPDKVDGRRATASTCACRECCTRRCCVRR